MALSAAQFLTPQGLIDAKNMFPGETDGQVRARIDAAIREGTSKTTDVATETRDGAISSWVYYRMWTAIYLAMASMPASSAQADEGSILITADQRATFRQMAEQALAEFNGYLATEARSAAAAAVSASVQHTIRY